MDWLEDRGVLTCRCGWEQTHRAGDATSFIGQDVAKSILGDHHVEETRLLDHTHRSVVNVHKVGGNVGILLHNLLCNLAPETGRSQDVGLIDHSDVVATLTGILISHVQDTFHFGTRIVVGVECVFYTILVDGRLLLLTEVHTTGELTDADEIGTFHNLILQGRLVYEAVEGGDWTDIGKETEFLAHSKQTLFGTNLCIRVVVVLGITYAGKKHGIGLHTGLEGLLRERITHLVDGIRSADGIFVTQFMTELLANGLSHGETLFHNLGSDTIAREDC